MLKNDVCGYVVKGPSNMKDYDILHMKITAIKDASVYVAEGKKRTGKRERGSGEWMAG